MPKVTSGKPAFLVISDGTSKESVDYANEIFMELPNTKYQIKDTFGSLIREKNVMFENTYANKKDRQRVIDEMARQNRDWKIDSHTNYREECEKYVELRKEWEWNLDRTTSLALFLKSASLILKLK
ncbi:hypothetical protein MMC12_000644 [Toensbergia leucococca]|nr:hypothetical protein [Toensbergia leucococca]